MNYRHAFHAGNFADVFKHILLVRMVLYLRRKDSPIFYLDTHAGVGVYDLSSEPAELTGEWRNGIARLAQPLPPRLAELLQPYLDVVGPLDASGKPLLYPGSPIVSQRLLRVQDRLTLCELHPADVLALKTNVGRDRRIKIIQLDGYTALKAYLPPKERRGIVLIDPPFEERNEFLQLVDHLRIAQRKWSTGVYVVWYPLKDPQQVSALATGLVSTGISRILRLHLTIGRKVKATRALIGCGLIIINPPFSLESEAKTLLPFLSTCLAQDLDRSWSVEWLADGQ